MNYSQIFDDFVFRDILSSTTNIDAYLIKHYEEYCVYYQNNNNNKNLSLSNSKIIINLKIFNNNKNKNFSIIEKVRNKFKEKNLNLQDFKKNMLIFQ